MFARGQPEPIVVTKTPEWDATLYDLLAAYSRRAAETCALPGAPASPGGWSLAEAREALQRLIGIAVDWTALDDYLTSYVVEPA